MAIDVGGHLDVGVAQPFLNILEIAAITQQEAGAGVSKIMETDMGKIMVLQKFRKTPCDVIRAVEMSVRSGENIIAFVVFPAK